MKDSLKAGRNFLVRKCFKEKLECSKTFLKSTFKRSLECWREILEFENVQRKKIHSKFEEKSFIRLKERPKM